MYERLWETWSLLSPPFFFFFSFVPFSSAIRGSTLTTMWAGHCANLQPGPPRRPSTSLWTCLPCPVRVQTTSSEWAVLKVSPCSECYLLCNKSNTVRGTCLNSHLIALYISLCYLNDTFCLTWLQNKQEIQLHCITIPTSGKLPGTIALCDSRLLLYITVLSQRNVHHRWGSLWVGEGLMTRNVQEASWKYTCERGCYECREFLILCSYITLKKSFSWVSSVFCTSNHLNKVLLSFWPLMTLSLDRVRFLFWMCGVCRFVWIAGL